MYTNNRSTLQQFYDIPVCVLSNGFLVLPRFEMCSNSRHKCRRGLNTSDDVRDVLYSVGVFFLDQSKKTHKTCKSTSSTGDFVDSVNRKIKNELHETSTLHET